MEFPALLLALCVIAVAGGAAALLTAHQARHRLGGLTVMAAGPVVGLVALGPHRTGAVVAAALSALTIAGLLLVARYLEGAGAGRSPPSAPRRRPWCSPSCSPGRSCSRVS